MQNATTADLIYYKPVVDGVIYVLKYTENNGKQHTTVNNHIERLDDTLKLKDQTETTFFVSINDDQTLTGSKVLSFEREGRKENPLYRQLFGKKGALLPRVNVWNKEIAEAAELSEEENGHINTSDDEISEEEITPNAPVAVSTTSGSKGKNRATGPPKATTTHSNEAGSVSNAEKVHCYTRARIQATINIYVCRLPWHQ